MTHLGLMRAGTALRPSSHPVRIRVLVEDAGLMAPQNGFTITRMTMPIIRSVGTSLAIR